MITPTPTPTLHEWAKEAFNRVLYALNVGVEITDAGKESYARLIAEAHAKAHGWRSMESAPKDGRRILIWDGEATYAARWETKFSVDAKGYRAAWTDDAVVSFGMEETAEYKPTAWMPLPEPPKGDK